MKSLRILTIALISYACTSCMSGKVVRDMSHYGLEDFRREAQCDRNSQCKTVLAGFGQCGNYPKGAAEYFIYSTKIGSKNVRHLKRLAKASLPKRKKNIFNFEEGLIECTLTFKSRPPPLMCINHRCQVSYQ